MIDLVSGRAAQSLRRPRTRQRSLRDELLWRGAWALLELGAIITLVGIVRTLTW